MHVTGGVDLDWDDPAIQPSMRARFQADFNGDGILSIEEAALGNMAVSMMESTMDKRMWGYAREIRTGINFDF